MGFDSRHLVLEFLADNRELGIQQMTLVFLGKKSDPFLQLCLNTAIDKVFVYHNKGTRRMKSWARKIIVLYLHYD